MAINNIQFINNNKYINKTTKAYQPQFGRLPSLSKFDMHKNPVFLSEILLEKKQNFIKKFFPNKAFNLSTLIELFTDKKKYFEKIIASKPKKVVIDTIPMAQKIKTFLDNKFDKNYIFVSIGRSPVTIARTLEFMGVPVRYIPISGLHSVRTRLDLYTAKNLDNYISYIKNLGLNEEFLSKTGKKAVFYDYAHTGSTLSSMKHFIKQYVKLPQTHCAFRELNTDLLSLAKTTKEKNEIKEFINNYLLAENAETYSHIPKLNPCDVGKINDIIKKYTPEKNVLNFNKSLILMLEKKGLLAKK